MKLFSPNRPTPSPAAARNAALLNLLATPGLGSLLARRWLVAGGQLLLAITGFALFMIWFVKGMIQFYGQINGTVEIQPIGKYLTAGVILFASAWVWSAFTSIRLLRAAAASRRRAFGNSAAPPMPKLAAEKIPAALTSVPDWNLSGATIVRTYQFKDFPSAIKFVGAIAELAEEAWHHPDIDIRWNKVTLTLSTHDAGGLTEKDFALARQFDRL